MPHLWEQHTPFLSCSTLVVECPILGGPTAAGIALILVPNRKSGYSSKHLRPNDDISVFIADFHF